MMAFWKKKGENNGKIVVLDVVPIAETVAMTRSFSTSECEGRGFDSRLAHQ